MQSWLVIVFFHTDMWIKLLHTIAILVFLHATRLPSANGLPSVVFCVSVVDFQTLGTLFFSNTVSVDIAGKSSTDTDVILSSGSLSSPAAKLFFSSLQSRGHPALRLHQTSTLHPCLCNLFLVPPSHALPFCSSLCVPSCTATLPRSSIERLTVRMRSLSFRPLSSSLFGSKVLLLWL